MTDQHDHLREAIKVARQKCAAGEREKWWTIAPDHLAALADAAESTLPKTKMAEVWRVEFASKGTTRWFCGTSTYDTEADARFAAESMRCVRGDKDCIRVTGPHQQEIPA